MIVAPVPAGEPALAVARIRLSDIAPYDGSPSVTYLRAVEALSGSLMRYNVAVIELGMEDAVLMRCGLEAARLYLRTRVQSHTQTAGRGNFRGVYTYRAGRYSFQFQISKFSSPWIHKLLLRFVFSITRNC